MNNGGAFSPFDFRAVVPEMSKLTVTSTIASKKCLLGAQ